MSGTDSQTSAHTRLAQSPITQAFILQSCLRLLHSCEPCAAQHAVVIGETPASTFHRLSSFIHSFLPSFLHSFSHSFIHSFIHSLIHSFIHSLTHSFIQDFMKSWTALPSLKPCFLASYSFSCNPAFQSSTPLSLSVMTFDHVCCGPGSVKPGFDCITWYYPVLLCLTTGEVVTCSRL